MNNHWLRDTEEETILPETIAAATAAHTRYLSPPAATTLHGKNTRFRAPAFSPTQTPCNSHAAITLRFAASHGKPACLDTHGHKTWQLPCSHYTAICNQRFNKRIELRTTHTWATTRCRTPKENRLRRPKRSQPQPPHTQGTFHRRLRSLYTERQKVSCSGFLPNTNPMQQSCGHYNAFCSSTCRFIQHVTTSLSHHPSSPPFVSTLRHHFPQSPPSLPSFMWCLLCHVLLDVLLCDVKSHTTLRQM